VGVADHGGVAGADPFFWAWALLAASQARASMDKVMWAYQARQVRTWYWSSCAYVIGHPARMQISSPVVPGPRPA
jgi:hypothetical protein